MQYDIVGNLKFVTLMIPDAVHEDELSAVLLGHLVEKDLEAFGVGRWHDQIDTGSILRAYRTI